MALLDRGHPHEACKGVPSKMEAWGGGCRHPALWFWHALGPILVLLVQSRLPGLSSM